MTFKHDDDDPNVRLPPGMRYAEPSSWMMSSDCQVSYIITGGWKLLDSHEREAMRAGVRFTHYGSMSGADMIASETSHGSLMSWIDDAGKIQHGWSYGN